jgi:DNA-binding MarR family transcriptional regulator
MDTAQRSLPKHQMIWNRAHQAPDGDISSIETYLLFLRVASDVLSALQVHLGQYGLSDGKLAVLMLLSEAPNYSMTPSELAQQAGVTRGTITGLLDGLERTRLIERVVHPKNRRMLLIRLTPRGLDLLNQVLPQHFQYIRALMANLSEAEKQQLLVLLGKLDQGVVALR